MRILLLLLFSLFVIGCKANTTYSPDDSIDFQGKSGGIAYELIEIDLKEIDIKTIYLPQKTGYLKNNTIVSDIPPNCHSLRLLVRKSIHNGPRDKSPPPIERARNRFFTVYKIDKKKESMCFRTLGNLTSSHDANWIGQIIEIQKPPGTTVVFYDHVFETFFLSESELQQEREIIDKHGDALSLKNIYETMIHDWTICIETPTSLRRL